ncbi:MULTISPECIES: condensation domain-containing protein [Streptomyces]|uniref:Condensation domain-containing protein n=1 Tax=Streptomyces lonegramiae TaxID=3075524 RepID=A0ABU2XBJ4_9ACTN|nr:condensation domain-containing protein [Streptomyces sp. DSM 41529]MDT0543286.1 condensation domain-containing protein [Streptomyces sp. DSM 41529]
MTGPRETGVEVVEVVEVSGERTVRAPLTWGQQFIYRALQRRADRAHYDYNQRVSLPVPEGRTLREVIGAIRALVTAHESLRTVYRDGTADSTPYQEVHGEGRLTVRVVRGDDPAAALDALAGTDFDLSREWGIRAAVLTGPDGEPRHLALYVSHVAVDGWAMGLVVRELKAHLADGALVSAGAVRAEPVPQPADLAETERSEAGRTMDRRADAYQRSLLRRAPRSMFPEPADPAGPPEWAHGEFRSGRLEEAAREVAARCRAGEETVYLAAVGTLLARRAGLSHCALTTIFANRIGAARQAMVTPLAADVLLCFDVSGPSFDDCVRAAHLAKLRGYARAQYDPVRLGRLVAEVGRERGEQLDLSVLHNDLGALTPPEEGEGARGPSGVETSFRWAEPFRLPSVKLYCAVRTAEHGERVIAMAADTRYLPAPDLRELLYGVEELVVTERRGPQGPEGPQESDERLPAHVS